MITDEERRNVAANIRNAANRRKDDLNDDPDYSPFAALYVVSCEVRGFPRYKDLLHLADLIDRPTCHNIADYTKESFKCSRCGCRVLVPGDRPDGVLVVTSEAFPVDWYSCPVCGAVVLDD